MATRGTTVLGQNREHVTRIHIHDANDWLPHIDLENLVNLDI
jgi:hypothetical protein